MQTQADLLSLADHVLVKNYRQQPIVLERGLGCEVWDKAGTRYLDFTAGIAVCGLGHSHPEFTARVAAQLGKLVHVSNLYFNDQQLLAAKAITDRSFAKRVFFCNSGSEANEAAMKLARRYQAVIAGQPQRTTFVSTINSFHGRSFATVAITGQPKYREGFGPLVGPVEFIPYNDLEAAARMLEQRTACAIIVEPIQAEGGIITAAPGYLAGLRRLCDDTGTLLVFDEVQTGVGRTGQWFGHQHDDVAPDVMTLAKGLGGGVPIGAMMIRESLNCVLTPGAHGSTFGGNPLAAVAALAVLDTIERDGLLEQASRLGEKLGTLLTKLATKHSSYFEGERGVGLMRGLVLRPGIEARVVQGATRERGAMTSVASERVVRFTPPLVITDALLEEGIACVDAAAHLLAAPSTRVTLQSA